MSKGTTMVAWIWWIGTGLLAIYNIKGKKWYLNKDLKNLSCAHGKVH
jgi:hypothetical protein